jgi:hypothetical protein|tara:strand:- start:43517 stop:43699 length:183 start_codon:yes stop_codon:yes gene_type:complete
MMMDYEEAINHETLSMLIDLESIMFYFADLWQEGIITPDQYQVFRESFENAHEVIRRQLK